LSIESDSMEIVQAIQNPDDYRASGAVITDDCRKLMSSFGKATINHCVRDLNKCAHTIARFSFLGQELRVWLDKPPDFLIPLIVKDMIMN